MSTMLVFWPLKAKEDVRAATLFRDALSSARRLPRTAYLLATGLALATLIATAAWFSGSPWLTLWTGGGFVGALVLLALSAQGIR